MQDEPGTYELAVEVKQGEQAKQLSFNVLVAKEKFIVEHLTLPKEKVDLDEKAAARWKAEQEQVKQALAENSRLKLWHSNFVEPVNGKRTGIFGSVRIMNGKPRNPHNGEDIGAPHGDRCRGENDGSCASTVDHVFSGKGVFIDHGLGFYTMYFHLSEVLVKDGDLVTAGQIIGKVGATGRATGPHLHWGVKLNGARVNPYSLLDLPFKNGAVPPATLVTPISRTHVSPISRSSQRVGRQGLVGPSLFTRSSSTVPRLPSARLVTCSVQTCARTELRTACRSR